MATTATVHVLAIFAIAVIFLACRLPGKFNCPRTCPWFGSACRRTSNGASTLGRSSAPLALLPFSFEGLSFSKAEAPFEPSSVFGLGLITSTKLNRSHYADSWEVSGAGGLAHL